MARYPKQILFKLAEDMDAEIQRRAKEEDLPVSTIIRRLVAAGLRASR